MNCRKYLETFGSIFGEYPFVCMVREELLESYESRQRILTDLISTINQKEWCSISGGMNKNTWKTRVDFYAFRYIDDSITFREKWGVYQNDPCDEWNVNYFLN